LLGGDTCTVGAGAPLGVMATSPATGVGAGLGVQSSANGFPAGESYTCFEAKHMDGSHFPHHGSHPTGSKGDVRKTIKTSSGHMVKCWISKIYLTNLSIEPSTFSHPM
jgi:hypothetical protein